MEKCCNIDFQLSPDVLFHCVLVGNLFALDVCMCVRIRFFGRGRIMHLKRVVTFPVMYPGVGL